MSSQLSSLKSSKGEVEYVSAYDAVLKLWPVHFEENDVMTRFGTTHVIASGSKGSPSLLVLHATGTSSTMWFPNIDALSSAFRVYVVDIIGEPGKSRQSRLLRDREDCANWLGEVMQGLGLKRTNIAGLSYGGWHTLNFSLFFPDKVNKIVALAPGASILPFSWSVLLMLRLLPYVPIKPNPFNSFFNKGFHPNELFARQFASGVKHFRYSNPKKSIFPNVFSEVELGRINVPTLFIVGENEVIYDPVDAIEKVNRLIPNVETKLVPNAGHLVSMEQPTLVNQHILEFLG
ncbi:MAG: alpha/beta hydrolase [Methanosarcina sp.]|uniref:alpha/beta fold hydrolase n=1 Tax=Methanosarcina sp. TaxID=2213 RepID=UPI00261934A2|nr:alpha/beta hydrolase [Methanosarcina sp.]MDD3246615.1 alpha/beta hydrolase [Methanosarcina sp.]MDD4248412.1 alpha/beta hydrolase [Methanosarcina sp.]